jgi:hypothetical protein
MDFFTGAAAFLGAALTTFLFLTGFLGAAFLGAFFNSVFFAAFFAIIGTP